MPKFSWLKIIYALGIGILTLIVVMTGIGAFYPNPDEYDRFIGSSKCAPIANTQEVCTTNGGTWQDYSTDPNYPKPLPPESRGYCNYELKCAPLREIYNRNVGIFSIIMGLVLLGLGLRGHNKIAEFVSRGISIGGVMIVIWGVMQFWGQLTKQLQFFVGLIALIALIWIGTKYSKKFTFKE